jgi:glutamate/tyrosine decarboxylase-like PLP-dependent enzyme
MTYPTTWDDVASRAVGALEAGQMEIEVAQDWMDSECSDGPLDPAKREEAAELIRAAQRLIDQARDALRASAEQMA